MQASCHDAVMIDGPLLERAQRLWVELAGAPVVFSGPGINVVASPLSLLCPPGWVGIVALGGAAIATAPDSGSAETVRQALDGTAVTAVTDPTVVCHGLPMAEILGPATLAYCDAARFRPVGTGAVEMIPADHADLGTFLARVSAEDADESGLMDITSSAFVVRAGTGVVAAAGYQLWPAGTAHLSVLTAVEHRGLGLARVVATSAVREVLAADLLPQWRARPEASRRAARALGFDELGSQLSIRLVSADRSIARS